jgi:hypothetical protein
MGIVDFRLPGFRDDMKPRIHSEFRGVLADFRRRVDVEESGIGVVDVDDVPFVIRDNDPHLHVVQEFPEKASLLGQGMNAVGSFLY